MLSSGFLPFSRASFMLDVVALAMIAVVPILSWSIYLVAVKHNYRLHKLVQIVLGSVLLVAVILFEIDIRLHGWRHLAEPSPYYGTPLTVVLVIHLFFAVSTTLLWIITMIGALRRFPSEPKPSSYSPMHKKLGIPAAIGMYCTAVTGWTFYYMAFVA